MLVESSLAQASGGGRPGLVFRGSNGEARADLDQVRPSKRRPPDQGPQRSPLKPGLY